MTKKTIFIGAGIVVALTLVVAIRLWTNAATPPRLTVAPVRVQPPKKQTLSASIIMNGDILPVQQAIVFARVQGNLSKVYKDIGDYVRQGEVLALIDDAAFRGQVARTEAAFVQSDATYQNTTQILNRSKELVSQQLISKQEFDNLETQFRVAKARADADRAVLNDAKLTLSYTRIIAPFSGYITRRNYDAGAFVGAAQTSEVFTMMDLKKVRVVVNVLEKDIPRIESLTEASVKVDALPDKVFKAQVTRINKAVDLATRTVSMQLEIDNKDQQLRPGMFATIALSSETHRDALVVPKEAILKDTQGSYVMTAVTEAGKSKAKKALVKTGASDDVQVEISEGVSIGDKIITTGQQSLRDGAEIKISN